MITRRGLLKSAMAAFAMYPYKNAEASQKKDKILNMYNIHTDENLNICYSRDGQYDIKALSEINHFLRCHYNNEVKEICLKVIDLLTEIKDIAGGNRIIEIISGYRSLAYNNYLIRLGRQVSRNSQHLYAMAIDFAIPGVCNRELLKIASSLGAGGVGYYHDFIHIDSGRVRYWGF